MVLTAPLLVVVLLNVLCRSCSEDSLIMLVYKYYPYLLKLGPNVHL